jgi:hypothetical protein
MRKFLDPNSVEAKKFCDKWDNSSVNDRLLTCKELNANYDSAMRYRRNISIIYPLSKQKIEYGKSPEKEPLPIINLPELKIREFVPKPKSGTEEIQVVLLSDSHAGKITNSFNDQVYKTRIQKLFDKILLIKHLQENSHPVNKLVIPYLGDMVQGENPHQGSKVGDISMGARDQVIKLAFPTNFEFICSLKQHYSEISIECWAGNHGSIGKEAPQTSNWDLMLYDLMKSTLEKKKGIKINIHEDFGSVIKILNHNFFCLHGDGTTTNGGVPWMALSRKISKWYMQYKGFEYVVLGHFHTTAYTEIGRNTQLFMNGALVSDDDWSLKKMGISSTPTQWTFGVHPIQGVSWQYPLNIE